MKRTSTPETPSPQALLAWRNAHDLSQREAAKIAGVDPSNWSRWERGDTVAPQWLADTLHYRWGSRP